MTKAEFIKRLEDQFQGMIESVKRRTAAEIEGSRSRMDTQAFADWIRSERDKANAEPALKAFDTVLKASHSTPHDAADSLAALIEMDTAPDDWQTQWDSAAPLISNFRPEKSDGWKYRRAFADYMAAVKAEARAGIFAEAISENTPGTRNPKQKPKVEPPAFADLFVSAEAMEKALEAARAVGLIEGNAWVYTGKDKVKKLRIWYTAALRWGLAKGGISTKRATNMMKEGIHFDRLHKDAVQAIPLLEIYRDHDNTYIYNTMLAIMKV